MTWRCALIQRRLPDYPDGDLSPFWRRLVAAHLNGCADCRQELEELTEMMQLYQAHPLPDPGPAFWQEFDRELHLKLAQVNQAPHAVPWRPRVPHYILGATALAGVLTLAVYLGPFTAPSPDSKLVQTQEEAKPPVASQPPKTLQAQKPFPVAPAPLQATAKRMAPELTGKGQAPPVVVAKPEAAPAEEAEFNLAAGKYGDSERAQASERGLWLEDDILSWDVDSVVADLSQEERQDLKRRLESGR